MPALLLAAPLAYLLAALLLGLVPVNINFTSTPESAGGVPVFVRTNGVHADLVLPAAEPHDWTREFPHAALIDLAHADGGMGVYQWVAFGWGDRAFYLTTPTWADLKPGTAWQALSGQGRGAMHVEYLRRPQDYEVEPMWVSQHEYAALVAYVRAWFARDAGGRVQRIDHPGFGAADAFFEAEGSYSPWLTSNDWVRRGLSQAGVRTAAWSPFDRALLWHARHVP